MRRIFLFLFCAAGYCISVNGQSRYPQDYFRLPVDIPPYLSGTFGEPRTTHFHAGLDIKTQQSSGIPIVAAADGYVYRMNVTSLSYGRALYIRHPNGYTTVYGHLSKFADTIQAYADSAHNKQKKFDLELYPLPDELPVKKGEIIAFSGNTGGSAGPHLHFEIRDPNEIALNPLLFGIQVTDKIKPYITEITLYDQSEHRFFHEPVNQKLISAGNYLKLNADTLFVNSDQVGVSIVTFDQANGSSNSNGVYAIKMLVDSQLVYAFTADAMGMNEIGCVCGHVDYRKRIVESKTAHHCFVMPGNNFSGYDAKVNQGKISLNDKEAKEIIIEVSDYNGNLNRVRFFVRKNMATTFFKDKKIFFSEVFPQDKVNQFVAEDVKITFPVGSLYDTLHFNYATELPTTSNVYSHYHYIHDPKTPPAGYYDIAIKTENLPAKLISKALLVRKDHNQATKVEKATMDGDYMVGRSKYFGKFYVLADTTAPYVKGRNIYGGKDMRFEGQVRLTVSDNLSGISEWYATIDDEWVLFEYEHKDNLLYHNFKKTLATGEHKLVITVTDERKNSSTYQTTFKK